MGWQRSLPWSSPLAGSCCLHPTGLPWWSRVWGLSRIRFLRNHQQCGILCSENSIPAPSTLPGTPFLPLGCSRSLALGCPGFVEKHLGNSQSSAVGLNCPGVGVWGSGKAEHPPVSLPWCWGSLSSAGSSGTSTRDVTCATWIPEGTWKGASFHPTRNPHAADAHSGSKLNLQEDVSSCSPLIGSPHPAWWHGGGTSRGLGTLPLLGKPRCTQPRQLSAVGVKRFLKHNP